MDGFESLLAECNGALERFVYFRLPSKFDAEDILQEVRLTAYMKFDTLKEKSSFKPWLLSIARNKCNDYFRRQAVVQEVSLDALPEGALIYRRCGRHIGQPDHPVRDTMELLEEKEREILELFYFCNLKQEEIAVRLGIPIGTVKSRLHTAKVAFKKKYSSYLSNSQTKGEDFMKKMPVYLPEYSITPSNEAPFPVKWEELMGWFIIPRVGEHQIWGSYDMPMRKLTETVESTVTGKVMLHGVEGVEIKSIELSRQTTHYYMAQLTDTHCRWLGERYEADGVLHYLTFLDGDEFLAEWNIGEDNCGSEILQTPKNKIICDGNAMKIAENEEVIDVVGRWTVYMGEKRYDTVRLVYISRDGIATQQYLDQNGRTVLWRRFNRDDWKIEHYGKRWSEQLPESEQITINGEVYVHWYDCITDYIL